MSAVSGVPGKQEAAATPQQAAPVAKPPPAYHDDLPIMSNPPRDYAPPVKTEGINSSPKITPLRQLRKEEGPEPDWVKCPFCKKITTIRRVSEPSDEAKCLAVCCCTLGVIVSFLPSSSDLLEKIDIHCGSCEKHIATIPPDGEVEMVRLSERPPLPSAKKPVGSST
ncbi:hypothetical protein E0Z10_g475 [Xylaria hypoxylon]|uniref:LITAF domain-containing protein n=1 Tax=Xylaria hypoxylon TaxID=37992 RepID=A0A4Z0ZH95_9PEZI|nr:hypothetical protein E0Z10_g475 [Xylaria hypoxylon]